MFSRLWCQQRSDIYSWFHLYVHKPPSSPTTGDYTVLTTHLLCRSTLGSHSTPCRSVVAVVAWCRISCFLLLISLWQILCENYNHNIQKYYKQPPPPNIILYTSKLYFIVNGEILYLTFFEFCFKSSDLYRYKWIAKCSLRYVSKTCMWSSWCWMI